MTSQSSTSDLELLFRPRRIAVVGAGPNDPSRMGTRTLYDLVSCRPRAELFPVSSRHEELYGLKVYRSVRELPAAPDVVLARTPSGGVEALVDDAVAVGARFLVVLASGFAESGVHGAAAQRAILDKARAGGLRIVGPQSIGLVNCRDALPMSLSQIMERLDPTPGRIALLSQSGAMAISLAVRGQVDQSLHYSYVATFGNSADVHPIEALEWLARDPHTDVVGLYLEGLSDGRAFARAAAACKQAGKAVVVLRAGLSRRGAQAVASHTASMSGDAEAFRAACRQLGVVLCDSSESFLWSLKALSGRRPPAQAAVAFASISGGACALWADQCERLSIELPALTQTKAAALRGSLPSFLQPANPLDLGPAVFDPQAFGAALQALLGDPQFDMLLVYMFTSSPSLMGGLDKVRQIEALAQQTDRPVWVVWEAATQDEWNALSRSTSLTAFRDLARAAATLAATGAAAEPMRFEWPDQSMRGAAEGSSCSPETEYDTKEWLRRVGLTVPKSKLCTHVSGAQEFAAGCARGVVVKVVAPEIRHKSDVGGVAICPEGAAQLPARYAEVLRAVRQRLPDVQPQGVLVEELIDEDGLELFASVARDPVFGLVTLIGRGGIGIEVDRDFAVHVGLAAETDVLRLLSSLRCAPLLGAFRGRPALAQQDFAQGIVRIQHALLVSDLQGVELNPCKITAAASWVLDALPLQAAAPAA